MGSGDRCRGKLLFHKDIMLRTDAERNSISCINL